MKSKLLIAMSLFLPFTLFASVEEARYRLILYTDLGKETIHSFLKSEGFEKRSNLDKLKFKDQISNELVLELVTSAPVINSLVTELQLEFGMDINISKVSIGDIMFATQDTDRQGR